MKHYPSSRIIIACLALTLASCGGGDPRNQVPGHLEPGPVRHVVDQTRGTAGDNGIERMAVGKYVGYLSPNMAALNESEVVYRWDNSIVSGDGESLRFDHWVAVKVRESYFIQEQWQSDAIYLNSLDDVTIDANGEIVGKRMGKVDNPLSADASSGEVAPWAANANRAARVTVVEADGQRPPRTVSDQVVPGSQLNAGAPDSQRLQSILDRINTSSANAAPAAGTPSAGNGPSQTQGSR